MSPSAVVEPVRRSFAILEALTGQIYHVTVVAVLVGNLAVVPEHVCR